MIYRMDITGIKNIPFRVLYIPGGETPPHYPAAKSDKDLVEFYDLRYKHTPDGQFVSRYYASTLVDGDEYSLPLRGGSGLCLQGSVPDWNLPPESVEVVLDWLESVRANPAHYPLPQISLL